MGYSPWQSRVKKTIHSDAQKEFCGILRVARQRKKLTQAILAERLGKPQSFVAKVERGERRLDVVEFVRYAKAISADPARLIARLSDQANLWT